MISYPLHDGAKKSRPEGPAFRQPVQSIETILRRDLRGDVRAIPRGHCANGPRRRANGPRHRANRDSPARTQRAARNSSAQGDTPGPDGNRSAALRNTREEARSRSGAPRRPALGRNSPAR